MTNTSSSDDDAYVIDDDAPTVAERPRPLCPAHSGQLHRWYPLVIGDAIRAARGLGALESDAEDRVHRAIEDLIEGWTREVNPLPFPNGPEHFRGLLITRLRCRAIDATRRLETLMTTSRLGTPADDTPLEDVIEPLTEFAATAIAPPLQETPLDVQEAELLDRIIMKHLEALPKKMGDAFWWRVVNGWPREWVASHLRISVKTVDYHVEEARKRMQASIRTEHPLVYNPSDFDVEVSRWGARIQQLGARLDEREKQRKQGRKRRAGGEAA